MTQLDTSIPSTRWLQRAIQNKLVLEVTLSTAESISGRLSWLDVDCICLQLEGDRERLIWRQALVSVRALSDPTPKV